MILFVNVGDEIDIKSVNTRIGLAFYIQAFFNFMAVCAAPQLIMDREVFIRERTNGYYAVIPFCISNFLNILPGLAVISAVTGVIYCPATGILPFYQFFITIFLSLIAAEGLVHVVSALVPHYIISIVLCAGTNGAFMLTSGWMQVRSDIPDYAIWFHHIDYQTYSFRLMMVQAFESIPFLNTGTADWESGPEVLETFEMDSYMGSNKLKDYAALMIYGCVLQLLLWMIFIYMHTGRN